jgi:dipeptidyl aminopeptidase/acylaminoacyl peptidase
VPAAGLAALLAAVTLTVTAPAALGQATPAPTPDRLQTEAERSDYRRTMTHAQVMELCGELAAASDRVHQTELGVSHEGRVLPLLIVADPPVTSAEAARADRRREVVLLFANIHAGEVCGKEGLLMLAREMALADERPAVLENLIVAIAPILNADGNEVFAPDNRPGQVGPDEMGQRPNAQGLDLNRDWVKLDAPETRAIVRFMNEWDPIVVLDSHTTDGSRHEYVITHQGPKHPAGDASLIEFVRDDFLPAIDTRFAEATPYESFVYGNFNGDKTLWTTYPAEPRYGAAYRGMRNRIGILCEAYAYATYRDRVIATLEFSRAVLDETSDRARDLRRRLREADRRIAEAPVGTPVALRAAARPLPGTFSVRGFEEPEGRRGPAGAPRTWELQVENDWQPTLTVPRPVGYVIPAAHRDVADHLVRHGITVERLRETIELKVESYPVLAAERAARVWQGRTRMTIETGPPLARRHRVEPGDFVVRCDQSLGNLAAYLLEPMATDGLGGWGFIDVAAGDRWPILRLAEDVPLTTITLRDPDAADEAGPRRRFSYELAYGSRRGTPNLSGSPARTGGWVDAEHYIQTRGGRAMVVHARSGRATPRESMAAVAAERLAAVPGIDERDARGIARRWSGGMPETSVVFSHADDLWLASPDASTVTRLTRHPGEEELADLAPGGDWVGFTRDGDLFAVDTRTGGERQLTVDGGGTVRNGRASWVYFEELFGRNWRAFWWSPTGDRIAFLRTEEAPVPHHMLLDNRGDGREEQRLERERYPRPGDRNPDVTLHVADPVGGSPIAVDLGDYTEGDYLVTHVSWVEDGAALHVHVQDRAQTWLDILRADPRTGRTTRLFRDATEAWITSPGAPRELADGSFLIQSERSGWNHLYRHAADGTLMNPVSTGDLEVSAIQHVDEVAGTVMFTANLAGPVRSHLFVAPLDGSSAPVRLTRETGSHRVSVSPDGRHFIDSWSSFEHPTRVALRDAAGDLVRMIDDNPVTEIDRWDLGTFSHERITLADGVTLDATLQLPPGFDPSRKYPVWFMTYAGPQAPSIRMGWWAGRTWDHVLAASGIVVFRADPYPASGQGAQSAWTAYRRLGERETEDIEELIAWLCEHEWVDADRIGMAGHSYGGFITAMAMTRTKLFRSGIAGAPVTDWRLYDTIYTERYMGTLQDNPDGYANTSVVNAARELSGRLLLAWGDMDDNVHPANAIRLLDRMVAADRDVVPLMYPGRRHGISSSHYRRMQYEFIMDTLEPEAPAPAGAGDEETSGEPGNRAPGVAARPSRRSGQARNGAPTG